MPLARVSFWLMKWFLCGLPDQSLKLGCEEDINMLKVTFKVVHHIVCQSDWLYLIIHLVPGLFWNLLVMSLLLFLECKLSLSQQSSYYVINFSVPNIKIFLFYPSKIVYGICSIKPIEVVKLIWVYQMDLGVGSFVLANALVSRQARNIISMWVIVCLDMLMFVLFLSDPW